VKNLALFIPLLALVVACGGSEEATTSGAPTASPLSDFRVAGIAMFPALADGDVVRAVPYGTAEPQRADVIVYRNPISGDRLAVRRIIGLPGETITIDESTGAVSVNGQPIEEPYIQFPFGCSRICTWTLAEAGSADAQGQCGSERCYFILGDNRPSSVDSRQGWLLPAENIIGRVESD
jgi:signal peptidase I